MSATRLAAVGFLGFSLALAAASWGLPSGVGAVPGPAFFPLAIAAAMAALSLMQLMQPAEQPEGAAAPAGAARLVGGVIGLLFLYLLLWGTGLFAVRTALFLCLLLRWTGQSWRASAGVAGALTAVVVVAFQIGLRVSLE